MQVTHYWMHSMLQVVMKEDKEDWYEEIKIFGSCGLKYLWRFISTQKYIQDYKDNLTQQHHVSFKFDIFPVLLSSYILNKTNRFDIKKIMYLKFIHTIIKIKYICTIGFDTLPNNIHEAKSHPKCVTFNAPMLNSLKEYPFHKYFVTTPNIYFLLRHFFVRF